MNFLSLIMDIKGGFTKRNLKSFKQTYSENYQGISYNLHTVYPISHLFENNKDFIIAFNCLQKFLSKRHMLMYRNHVSFISSKFLTNCCLTTVEKILIFLLPLSDNSRICLGENPRHAKQTRYDRIDWVIVYFCQTGI